jgi:hypothetical protein
VIVSHFEIRSQQLTPVSVDPLAGVVGRCVVTGYHLSVTNLDTRDITFRIVFRASSTADPSRALDGLLFRVNAGSRHLRSDNVAAVLGPSDQFGDAYRRTFTVRRLETVHVSLEPDVSGVGIAGQPAPMREARGMVSMTATPLPGYFTEAGRYVPSQSLPGPVQVLLHAELRTTYLPGDYRRTTHGNDAAVPVADLDVEHATSTLTLSTGKALNFVNPEDIDSGFDLEIADLDLVLREPRLVTPRSPGEFALQAAIFLGELAVREGKLDVFERLLEKLRIAARVTPMWRPDPQPPGDEAERGNGQAPEHPIGGESPRQPDAPPPVPET